MLLIHQQFAYFILLACKLITEIKPADGESKEPDSASVQSLEAASEGSSEVMTFDPKAAEDLTFDTKSTEVMAADTKSLTDSSSIGNQCFQIDVVF